MIRLLLVQFMLASGLANADSKLSMASTAIDCMPQTDCHRIDFRQFEHIDFGSIPANVIDIGADGLRLDVMASASFLMQGFDDVLPVTQVNVVWRSEGKPMVRDASHEADKTGDDAVFKVGLLLRAEEARWKPFLPSWMQRVEASMKYPSQSMLYLVADSRHPTGTRWANPYNDRITMVSMRDEPGDDGWQYSAISFDEPVEVVAVWLMADGDNTGSAFTAEVREVLLR